MDGDPVNDLSEGWEDPEISSARMVLEQTERLARRLCRIGGWNVSDDYRIRESCSIDKINMYWTMACAAQEELMGTDVENAIAVMENYQEEEKQNEA